MPINESLGRPSNLTQQQQREAMRSLYGLAERDTAMSPNAELTYEDRVKLRRLLDTLDQKEAGGLREFDLNNPPVPKYAYREYPFLMYRDGQTRSAHNLPERQTMRAEGWSEDPFPPESSEQELTAAEREEAEQIDKQLKKRRS